MHVYVYEYNVYVCVCLCICVCIYVYIHANNNSAAPALTLPTLRKHVLNGLGEGHADVFVHTCARALGDPADKEAQAQERQAISDMYRELIPPGVLKAAIVTSSGYGRTPQTTYVAHENAAPAPTRPLNMSSFVDDTGIAHVPRVWEYSFETYPLTHLVQFESGMDLMRLVLREEIREQVSTPQNNTACQKRCILCDQETY